MRITALFLSLIVALPGPAADWLGARNDAEGTGWQRYGTSIAPATAHSLKPLWKLKLDNKARGANSLTVPTMLGPIITHRGIKELVLIAGASGTLYAVDADKGTIFWKRSFPEATAPEPCSLGLTATPAIAPQRPGTKIRSEDDQDGGSTPLRPFYLVSADGMLHTVRPSDGLEMAPARRFAPADANLSALTLSNGILRARTPGNCGSSKPGEWSVNTADRDAAAAFTPGDFVAPDPSASWTDSENVRWIYRPAANDSVEATRGTGKAWTTPKLNGRPLPPAIVNGVVFVLTTKATLYAFDAKTGKQLYSSGSAISGAVDSSGLAIANGHIAFATADGTLHVFGFPIEM